MTQNKRRDYAFFNRHGRPSDEKDLDLKHFSSQRKL